MRELSQERRTILVVDDEPSIVDLLRAILRQAGYDVVTADHPDQAIALCSDPGRPMDLVVSDFTMPGQNGIELAKNLQRIRPALEFVFVSASPDGFDELMAEGFVCLLKPFPVPELLKKIRERLAASQQPVAGDPAAQEGG